MGWLNTLWLHFKEERPTLVPHDTIKKVSLNSFISKSKLNSYSFSIEKSQ